MHHSRSVSTAKLFFVAVVLLMFVLPLMTGCDFIDQLIEQIMGGGTPGGSTANAPTAVMTVVLDDALVSAGLNPDLRPPVAYQFNGATSLNEDGVPITDPIAGFHELSWDYGDGMVIPFTPSKSTRHLYRAEGPHTASLTVRGASGATDTVYQTITLGPGWLEIVSLATTPRPDDGDFLVTVVARNQSNQALTAFSLDLLFNGTWLIGRFNGGVLGPGNPPDRLIPGGTATFTTAIGNWTGTLVARSGPCTALPVGQ